MSTETEVAARFAADVAQHQMTTLHDDGLYRHLRFMRVAPSPKTSKPERSSSYWFELVTWPGSLTVNGDCGSFTFSRTEDMFEFFRGGRINPQYWAEKVRGETRLRRYSGERFREHVMDDVREREADHPGLTEAAEREIFGDGSQWNTEHEEGAREALDGFTFGDTFEAECRCGEQRSDFPAYEDARLWLAAHVREKATGHWARRITTIEGFRFTDTWEWELGDWDWQYLWCCHAIQRGIWQYDGRPERKPEPAQVPIVAMVTLRPTETVELPT
jgi:hypothetical protein